MISKEKMLSSKIQILLTLKRKILRGPKLWSKHLKRLTIARGSMTSLTAMLMMSSWDLIKLIQAINKKVLRKLLEWIVIHKQTCYVQAHAMYRGVTQDNTLFSNMYLRIQHWANSNFLRSTGLLPLGRPSISP